MFSTNFFKIIHLIIINVLISNYGLVDANDDLQKPNVIIIMADDMGLDDVSFRGSNRFLTPNIDALAYSGVILNNLYTGPMCTPSRSAFFTGKYPIHTGMQHYVIANDEPWSLPVKDVTMPELFQKNGYFTSLIGKWHQGMSRKSYTPNQRGFDHFFGYLGAYIDYWDHTLFMSNRNYFRGHDLKRNMEEVYLGGLYATDLFTQEAVDTIYAHNVDEKPLFLLLSHLAPHSSNDDNPLQAPQWEMAEFDYIEDENQRTYAAMMSILDKSVGRIIEALADKDMLDNSLIMFLSDNGAPTEGMHSTTGSNYPLRGQKNSPWEGALRTSAVIWSRQIDELGVVLNQRMYIGDLFKTLLTASYIDIPNKLSDELDGLDLWFVLKYGYQSVDREILHNIDEQFNYVSYMKDKWKYIKGSTNNGEYDYWMGLREPYRFNSDVDPRSEDYVEVIQNTTVWQTLYRYLDKDLTKHIETLRSQASIKCQVKDPVNGVSCNPMKEPCLFDLDIDPCEQNNLYERKKNSSILKDILEKVEQFRQSSKPINNLPSDNSSNPKFYDRQWTWWQDVQDERNASNPLLPHLSNLYHFSVMIIFLLFGKLFERNLIA